MAVKLIYQVFAKLLNWMVLQARTDTDTDTDTDSVERVGPPVAVAVVYPGPVVETLALRPGPGREAVACHRQ
jgi:hypothetical protein